MLFWVRGTCMWMYVALYKMFIGHAGDRVGYHFTSLLNYLSDRKSDDTCTPSAVTP